MLQRRCVILFVLGFLIDVFQTVHIQACARRQIVLSVVTVWCIYLTGFVGHKWFVESKSAWARWWITVAGALGAGCGTTVVLLGDWF